MKAPPSDAAPPDAAGWPPELLGLFSAHRVEMIRLAHVVSGSNAAAEDILQDAFVRLRRRWPGVANPGG
jgi:DNA-directed RNA polymerase specialized sigma24 family protein